MTISHLRRTTDRHALDVIRRSPCSLTLDEIAARIKLSPRATRIVLQALADRNLVRMRLAGPLMMYSSHVQVHS